MQGPCAAHMQSTRRLGSPLLHLSRALFTTSKSQCAGQSAATALKEQRHGRALGYTLLSTCARATSELPASVTTSSADDRLWLHNTMTKRKEPFHPRPEQGKRVAVYCCGVTVYDYSHVGHARVYCAFDVLIRLLQHLGYEVYYVRNFTDIDDKIIKRAAETGEEPLALSTRYIQEFRQDMQALNCLPASAEPRATEYVPHMVGTIRRILDAGHAYEADGSVWFSVEGIEGYGRLSGRSLEDNRAGERVALNTAKRNPFDFVLWKAAKPGEPMWESPWGPGRPGWHIECSSMIRELMGPVIDIHGGGRDLIHPHHDNELVQSQAAACSCDRTDMPGGRDFVRHWMHVGFVNVDSEKMSKSLGNFFTIRDVLQQYHPLALRWFLVNAQYQTALNYSQRSLEEASQRAYYVYQTLEDATAALSACGEAGQAAGAHAPRTFDEAAGGSSGGFQSALTSLLDDLNTPQALAHLSEPLKALNDLLHTKQGKKAAGRLEGIAALQHDVVQVLELLGLWASSPTLVLADMRGKALSRAGLSKQDVEESMARRAAARMAKDYAAADAERQSLAGKGILIMDGSSGTQWRPGVPEAGG